MAIEHISAVTFAVHDMAHSVGFYQKLGFTLVKDRSAEFTSLGAGDAFVNLATAPAYQHGWWGRVIFRVDDADAHYRILVAAGLKPDSPQDAPWGERFFHLTDPDGHQLSHPAPQERNGITCGMGDRTRLFQFTTNCPHLSYYA